jgi:hypothetical protein
VTVLGTAGNTTQSAPATETTKPVAPNPAVVEGIPSSLGVQVASAEGSTTITQVKALQIAEKRKPVGAKSVAVKHVLFAKSGADKPADAWMVTFHDAQLPGAGGASTQQAGSITIVIDSKSGVVLDELAYEPVAK